MTNNQITKNEVVKEPGTIFSAAVTGGYFELSNYKYIDFIVVSGVGSAANTTVTVKGKLGESGTPANVPFREKTSSTTFVSVSATGKVLSVGGTAGNCGKGVFRITADELSALGYDRVNINTTIISSSTVPGSIVAVLGSPRYTE